MKKFLLWGLAVLGLAACSNDSEGIITGSETEEISSERYMAVSLVANNTQTRDYANGSEDEYAVVSTDNIIFFFFDASGEPFAVKDGYNYIKGTSLTNIDWSTINDNGSNVTVSSVLAVLEGMTGSTPSQVVAVVNANFTPTSSVSLETLRKQIVTSAVTTDNKKNYFMMSNSVYYDGGEVYATKILPANLASTSGDAKNNPVNIHVERVAAKVTMDAVTAPIALSNTEITFAGGAAATPLYVKFNGWKLFNLAQSTYLEKDIEDVNGKVTKTTATDPVVWDAWNSAANFRSYWENPYANATYGTTTISWDGINNVVGDGKEYPLPNTAATEANTDNHTGIIFAATICDEYGNAVPMGYWLSQYYKLADLKSAIASYLSNTLVDSNNKAISADDITFAFKETTKDMKTDYYHAKVVVNTSTTWKSEGKTLSAEEVQAIADKIPNVQVWADGKCYYYTTIQHVNGADAIVRNHWYQVSINKVTGLGTPVNDPTQAVDPERPTEELDNWYLDAQINIQAWNIYKQSVDLVSRN